MKQESGTFRVLLIGLEDNCEEKRDVFCKNLSKNYGISHAALRKIVDRCPIILKKNLSQRKAESLAKTLKFFGAVVSVEEKIDSPPISLEFQGITPHRAALESTFLRRTPGGAWNVIGRVRNISEQDLNDIWVLIQLFNDLEEFLTFEEVPIPINPIPPGGSSPFKVVFEGDLPIERVSVAFKNSSGSPIPAVDRRKKREWVKVKIGNGGRGKPEFTTITESPDKNLIGQNSVFRRENFYSFESEATLIECGGLQRNEEGDEKLFEESLLSGVENDNPIEGGLEEPLEHELPQPPLKSRGEEKAGAETEAPLLELESHLDYNKDVLSESPLEVPRFEGEPQSSEEIPSLGEEAIKEGLPLFAWLESFRNAIEHYYQKSRDIFSVWFEERQKEDGFADSFHSLLTILVHARFDQTNRSEKALENTQMVFRLIVQPNLALLEIPPLEGMRLFSGEDWRELFYRAIPKLREVANDIFKQKRWRALELERLLQVIPHMSVKNSRRAVRWMKGLIPDVIDIDFSNTAVSIGESLYRVASRLGVVDPYFDYYQGKNSAADIKIQSFAKESFPHDPIKIEEPMTWVGREEEGHCFQTQPECEGCLFETFCPKLYFSFNPSEKGMKEQ